MLKINDEGDIVWQESYNGHYDLNKNNDFIVLEDGNYLTVDCKIVRRDQFSDFWVFKLNKKRKKIWEKYFGGKGINRVYSALSVEQNNIIIVGEGYNDINIGDSFFDQIRIRDIKIVKIDKNGKMIWDKYIGGDNHDIGYSAILTPFNEYLISGYTKSKGNGKSDLWIVKLDKDGNVIWDKTVGGINNDIIYCMKKTRNGSYIAAGFSESTEKIGMGKEDIWVLKFFDFTK